jgi:hypothetical protein
VPVILSRGDGVQGEPELLACTCQASFVLLAWARCHVEALLMCALGCGEALKDGGSRICAHADEVPCIFASWLSDRFYLRVRLWRSCHKGLAGTDPAHVKFLKARCSTLRFATLVASFQSSARQLKPIEFVPWAEKHSMPQVFEPKRPSKSDPEDAMMLMSWWFQDTSPAAQASQLQLFFSSRNQ